MTVGTFDGSSQCMNGGRRRKHSKGFGGRVQVVECDTRFAAADTAKTECVDG